LIRVVVRDVHVDVPACHARREIQRPGGEYVMVPVDGRAACDCFFSRLWEGG
jgi:hypothetical protein